MTKPEALRRAVHAAAGGASCSRDALSALDELQETLGLSAFAADQWVAAVRAERRGARS